MATLTVLETTVSWYAHRDEDYISLTDMARYRDARRGDSIIQNWMRNRSTIEFLGLWEQMNNPDFIVNAIMFCERMTLRLHADYGPSAQTTKYYCAYYNPIEFDPFQAT